MQDIHPWEEEDKYDRVLQLFQFTTWSQFAGPSIGRGIQIVNHLTKLRRQRLEIRKAETVRILRIE